MNTIQITISSETLTSLQEGGYELQVFRGTEAAVVTDGKPAVWMLMSNYLTNTNIQFEANPTKLKGYFSADSTNANMLISEEMEVGDILTLTATGQLKVDSNGVDGACMLESDQQELMTGGLATLTDDELGSLPFCGFPQYPTTANVLNISDVVLVVFSNVKRGGGDLVEALLSTSALVDFSSGTNSEVQLSFDIMKGWDGNDNSNVTTYPVNTNIAKVLIKPSETFKTELLKMS